MSSHLGEWVEKYTAGEYRYVTVQGFELDRSDEHAVFLLGEVYSLALLYYEHDGYQLELFQHDDSKPLFQRTYMIGFSEAQHVGSLSELEVRVRDILRLLPESEEESE